ncbi:putative reverse transcriptase domain-containing protein [Tanacetum coccineum]
MRWSVFLQHKQLTVAVQVKFLRYPAREMLLYKVELPVKTNTPEAALQCYWRHTEKMIQTNTAQGAKLTNWSFEMWNLKDAIEFATELMDKKINTWAERNGDRRPYRGPKPLCSKCNYHHEGPCAPKCHKCNRFGHLGRDCKNPLNVNTGANQRACFECGAQGHFKKDCPKLKNNNNQGNQAGNAKAQAKVYAVGNAGANPDNNVVRNNVFLT